MSERSSSSVPSRLIFSVVIALALAGSAQAIAYECVSDARGPVREYKLLRVGSDPVAIEDGWPDEAVLRIVGDGKIEFDVHVDGGSSLPFSAVLQ